MSDDESGSENNDECNLKNVPFDRNFRPVPWNGPICGGVRNEKDMQLNPCEVRNFFLNILNKIQNDDTDILIKKKKLKVALLKEQNNAAKFQMKQQQLAF